MASLQRYPEFVAELESASGHRVGYRDEGTLWIALNRDDREELARLERRLRERGFDAQRLNSTEVSPLEPHLSPRVVSAMRIEQDHQVDPRELIGALQRSVRQRGGRFLCPGQVDRVLCGDARVQGVMVNEGSADAMRLKAGIVVNAAGAWSTETIDLSTTLPAVRPVKGQILRLRGESLIQHVIRTPDVYLIPRAGGQLLIGATVEEMGFDSQPSAGAVMDLLRHAWEALPGCYDLEFEAVDVGLRPATADHQPLIGPTEVEGLFIATGHYRNGVLLAPVTAWMLCAMIDGEELDESGGAKLDVAAFDPRRALETNTELDG
jgi:glycine oxidase